MCTAYIYSRVRALTMRSVRDVYYNIIAYQLLYRGSSARGKYVFFLSPDRLGRFNWIPVKRFLTDENLSSGLTIPRSLSGVIII